MGYDAEIKRIGARALFDLKGAQADLAGWAGDALPAFPTRPNTMSAADGIELAHIGRDHWLVLADLVQEETLEAALRPTAAPVDISVVKVSDTLCFFAITGPDADQIMSIASPLDVHASVFPENGATNSMAFGLKALIARRPMGYWLAVEQSFGNMTQDYLSRAMA
jgi:heterotetrameric sarcosine oxidase gamma subunit